MPLLEKQLEPAIVDEVQSDGFIAQIMRGTRFSSHEIGSTTKSENRFTHSTIESPIRTPISEIRLFVPEPVITPHRGHSPGSMTKLAQDNSRTTSGQSQQFFEVESDTSLRAEHGNVPRISPPISTSRRQSVGSPLNYKRTAQWLRDILADPDSYSPTFTKSPKAKSLKRQLAAKRHPSEPIISSNGLTRCQTGLSAISSLASPKVDGLLFKRAMSDLERLLNEALALASQAVGVSETPSFDEHRRPSTREHSINHSAPESNDPSSNCPDDELPSSVNEFSDVDLDKQARPRRPLYKHAATHNSSTERPRLADIMQHYSGRNVEVKPQDWCDQPAEHAPLNVPDRNSSKLVGICPSTHACSSKFRQGPPSQLVTQPELRDEDLTSTTTEVVDFNVDKDNHKGATSLLKRVVGKHASSSGRPIDENVLPERDAASRRIHTEHGYSLRRRSHVSLRGTQGFNLARSHKRQPIARD
ncbi:hypothetical protein G7046_g1100 [Stylonectria norvegica]|nr:hypothetical protein G7046_g1100 [Stylonectria norvegica]